MTPPTREQLEAFVTHLYSEGVHFEYDDRTEVTEGDLLLFIRLYVEDLNEHAAEPPR